ncbi:hypothetical protein C8R47DRAFT_1065614 [Mycena vitilis]|nr:hypothetical protein C8R47DRAFT_1065614 [Mycena vitilis]
MLMSRLFGVLRQLPASLVLCLRSTTRYIMPPPRTLSREDADNRRYMGSIYSHRYYRKNREQRNEATRARMARLRAQDKTLPPDVLMARLAARREAARTYREKNRRKLRVKAREMRAEARASKESLSHNDM